MEKEKQTKESVSVKWFRYLKFRLILLSILWDVLYIGVCVVVIITLDKTLGVSPLLAWFLGWLMAFVYVKWLLKRKRRNRKEGLRIDRIRLTCVKDPNMKGYTVWSDQIRGLIVEVDKLEDAPEEVAKSIKVILSHGFDEGWHAVYELGSD